ncbi:MAG: HU family DNA-binding protein [Pseudomonadales bacterium]
MNKTQLIDVITRKMKIRHDRAVSNKDVDCLISSFSECVTQALADGDEVSIPGLGKFSTTERAGRDGRNPQTGEPIKIAPATVAKFTPAKALKEALNS